MMPCISASGEVGLTLFVFKGVKMPYREVSAGGINSIETPLSKLPPNSLMYFREEIGGVDSECFYLWALKFTQYISRLTCNGRKVLLTYDAHRSHMSLRVLEHFKENNVIVYALPAHTSGVTQPLDVITFGSMKQKLDGLISNAIDLQTLHAFDLFQMCTLIRRAFFQAFNPCEIISAFERAGLWHINHRKLLCVPRRESNSPESRLVSVEELELLFYEKRAAARREILGDDITIASSGFVDTTRGAVLNSERALSAVKIRLERKKEKEETARARSEEKKKAVATRRENEIRKQEEKRTNEENWIKRAERARILERARLGNMSVEKYRSSVRSLSERRNAARERASFNRRTNDAQRLLSMSTSV